MTSNDSYWSRFSGTRLSRRIFVRGAALAGGGLAGAALIGCGDDDDEAEVPAAAGAAGTAAAAAAAATAPTTGETVRTGGTLRYGELSSPDSLDPVQSGGGIVSFYTSLVYSRLFNFEPGDGAPASGNIVGDLIQTWERSDPLELVLHLNPAAKFDEKEPLNGRAVTAEDVAVSWERWEQEDTYRTKLANAASKAASIISMEAIDDSTVLMKQAFTDPTAIPVLASSRFWIQPVEGVAGSTIDLSTEPRGSAAFLFESFRPSVSLSYKRNPKWFRGGGERPYVDGVQIPILVDQAQREVQFRSKKLHLAAVSQTNIPQFAEDLSDTEIVVGGPRSSSPSMVFSYSPGQPWHDVRVRRALAMTIDRELMADVLFNPKKFEPLGVDLTVRWNAVLSAGYGAYWLDPKSSEFGPAAQYLQHNPAEAAKMLSAAGFTEASPLEFDNVYPGTKWGSNWPQRVEIMQSMMQDAGVKMNGVSVDYVTDYTPNYMRAKALFEGKRTDAAMHFMPGGTNPDPLAYYIQRIHSAGSSSETGTKFPELDEMIENERAVTDFDERVAGIHDLTRWSIDNMVHFPAGPNTEGVDLIWSALRGPQRYRRFQESTPGLSADLFPLYWFSEEI